MKKITTLALACFVTMASFASVQNVSGGPQTNFQNVANGNDDFRHRGERHDRDDRSRFKEDHDRFSENGFNRNRDDFRRDRNDFYNERDNYYKKDFRGDKDNYRSHENNKHF